MPKSYMHTIRGYKTGKYYGGTGRYLYFFFSEENARTPVNLIAASARCLFWIRRFWLFPG